MKTKIKQFAIYRVIGRLFCLAGIHRLNYSHGKENRYFECKNCQKRKFLKSPFVNQPIDREWLNGL